MLQQEKDKIRRMVEMEIERLKGEIWQEKDTDDWLCSQVSRRLKQKTEDFDKLYQDHKKLETYYNWKQENLREVRAELKDKSEALTEQGQLMAETMTKVLEEAVKERMELVSQHYQEVERLKMMLDKVQTNYQTKIMAYQEQQAATTTLIQQLKKDKDATEDTGKMGIKCIRIIIGAQLEQMKEKMRECSAEIWTQWATQVAEFKLLREDAKNWKKSGENFYKMDEASIITIREDFSNHFYALTDAQMDAI